MLARANRIVRSDDYRNTVRRGRKSAAAHCVVYLRPGTAEASRFGFIVSKAVGNAVTRNTVRRRLKAVAHEILVSDDRGVLSDRREAVLPQGTDVVIRAMPASIEAPWTTLLEEITVAIERAQLSSKGPRA